MGRSVAAGIFLSLGNVFFSVFFGNLGNGAATVLWGFSLSRGRFKGIAFAGEHAVAFSQNDLNTMHSGAGCLFFLQAHFSQALGFLTVDFFNGKAPCAVFAYVLDPYGSDEDQNVEYGGDDG